ncbi:MAG: LacI family DNA-binding transcriptional regulator [Acidimicrobiales bacterium]
MADVARLAGVSSAAASLALRGRPGVSAATRRRVQEAAHELGYETRTAPAPVRPDRVAVMVGTSPEQEASRNAFYGPMLTGIAEEAARLDISVRLHACPIDDGFQPIDGPILDDNLDGIMAVGVVLSDVLLAAIDDLPLVLVDAYLSHDARPDPLKPARPHSSVRTDNAGGMQALTGHLLAMGHEGILLVGGDGFPSIAERAAAYRAAMVSARLEPRHEIGPHDGDRGLAVKAADLVMADPSITAVVGVNDVVAVSVMLELLSRGIRVPSEVSVVGFDGLPMASLTTPQLDTAVAATTATGRQAVTALAHRIRHPADPTTVTAVATRLRVGGSVGSRAVRRTD